ncbi:AAA family ATPase [Pelistega ratti]|uniref:AAA family ATPase n=1 Tax=Pelistega ratti TaxID=2652177 RepID=UPI00135B5D1E|nr:AAA family ATPase [Pelistega ratti]
MTTTHSIKLQKLSFPEKSFRKFKNIEINFAKRLTLIAGHNGVGKTTILGLLAGTFGQTNTSFKTYTEEAFSKSIENILHIDLTEVEKYAGEAKDNPKITIDFNKTIIEKRCSLTTRTRGDTRRARLVARNTSKDFDNIIGDSSKIPLPTIFLGVKRLISIGESDEKDVISTPFKEMHPDDKALIKEFITNIMTGGQLTDDISYQKIGKNEKRSAQPIYKGFNELSISLGQDSLGNIATALASFQKLKREMGNSYPGGLLLIDEIDVGFHPLTIRKLAKTLTSIARRLSLQIVATTHSPILIEEYFKNNQKNQPEDKVIYFFDSNYPHLKDNISFQDIQNDLELTPPCKIHKETMSIYFEDEETKEFFNEILPANARRKLMKELNINITLHLIPLKIGCNSLLNLPNIDPLFRQRVLVVDGDASLTKNRYNNTTRLPFPKNSSKNQRSPERLIKEFLEDLSRNENLLQQLPKDITSDYIHEHLLSSITTDARESNKTWWRNNFKYLKEWGIIKLWAKHYKKEVEEFKNNFLIALKNALKNAGQK